MSWFVVLGCLVMAWAMFGLIGAERGRMIKELEREALRRAREAAKQPQEPITIGSPTH